MAKPSLQRERLRKAKVKNQRIAIGVISAGLLLIAIAIVVPILIKQLSSGQDISGQIIMPSAAEYPMVVSNALGDPNAPVKVEEFSNYSCSHCLDFTESLEPQIIEKYIKTGQVYWVYYSYVWTEDMEKAAEANYCAADQDKYFEYRDILFANATNTSIGSLSEDNFVAFASALGMDTDAFSKCYNGRDYGLQVQKDVNYGRTLGVSGTPTFIVNGTLVYVDTLEEVIIGSLNNQ